MQFVWHSLDSHAGERKKAEATLALPAIVHNILRVKTFQIPAAYAPFFSSWLRAG